MGFLGSIADWLVSWSESPYAPLVLFVVSFLDSAAAFLPPEPLLIAMAVARPGLGILYAATATVSSVVGATITYYVGRLGGRPLAGRFVRRARIEAAEDFFQNHGTITTGVAAFTPVPYPVFALAAGISHLGIWRFVTASLVGRGARFLGIGVAIFFFGAAIQRFLEQYLGWTSVVVGALIVAAYIASRYFDSRFESRARERRLNCPESVEHAVYPQNVVPVAHEDLAGWFSVIRPASAFVRVLELAHKLQVLFSHLLIPLSHQELLAALPIQL